MGALAVQLPLLWYSIAERGVTVDWVRWTEIPKPLTSAMARLIRSFRRIGPIVFSPWNFGGVEEEAKKAEGIRHNKQRMIPIMASRSDSSEVVMWGLEPDVYLRWLVYKVKALATHNCGESHKILFFPMGKMGLVNVITLETTPMLINTTNS